MRILRRILPFLAAALALAPAAAASPSPWLASASNYTKAKRTPTSIRFIVIHVTEGPFASAVNWLRDPRAHASANFVVSRDGQVAQLVPLHDIAWHAGNWAVNVRSIGIEHAGMTDDPAGFPLKEYRASARLAGVIARRSLIPIDRRHIIGHYQVPDPNDPLQGGGIDGHTDPGPYWNWPLYMRLVKEYAFPVHHVKHKHIGLQVDSSTLYSGQVLAGRVPWRATVNGPVSHVAFVVDGRVRWIDHRRPFAFAGDAGLSTFPLANGRHRLELRAFGPKGAWTRDRFTIRVRNEAFELAQVGLRPKQQVAGVQTVEAVFTGAPPARVLLLLDGKEIDHDTSPPYRFRFDSRRVKDGRHTLTLRGRAADGRIVRSSVTVVVANTAPPAIVAGSLVDGQTVGGRTYWLVQTTGAVAHVDFLVDGAVRTSATAAPYAFDWDTTADTPGPHQLVVRAVAANGTTAEQSLTVNVAAPAAAG